MKVITEDVVKIGNIIYFYADEIESIMSFDLKTNRINNHGVVPGKRIGISRRFTSIEAINKDIYLVPFFDKVIVKFDTTSEEFLMIQVETAKTGASYMATYSVGKKLFFFGICDAIIGCLDTTVMKIKYYKGWAKSLRTIMPNEPYFRRQIAVINNIIYAPLGNSNYLFLFNVLTEAIELIKLGEKMQGYSGAISVGEILYLVPRRNGTIVAWNTKSRKIVKEVIIEYDEENYELTFCSGARSTDEIILFPMRSIKLKGNSNELIEKGIFSFAREIDEVYYAYEKEIGELRIYNNGKLDGSYLLSYDNEEHILHKFKTTNIIPETSDLKLSNFINVLSDVISDK